MSGGLSDQRRVLYDAYIARAGRALPGGAEVGPPARRTRGAGQLPGTTPRTPARSFMGRGHPFGEAFEAETGIGAGAFEDDFKRYIVFQGWRRDP